MGAGGDALAGGLIACKQARGNEAVRTNSLDEAAKAKRVKQSLHIVLSAQVQHHESMSLYSQ
jgi:hypothetical protein